MNCSISPTELESESKQVERSALNHSSVRVSKQHSANQAYAGDAGCPCQWFSKVRNQELLFLRKRICRTSPHQVLRAGMLGSGTKSALLIDFPTSGEMPRVAFTCVLGDSVNSRILK